MLDAITYRGTSVPPRLAIRGEGFKRIAASRPATGKSHKKFFAKDICGEIGAIRLTSTAPEVQKANSPGVGDWLSNIADQPLAV